MGKKDKRKETPAETSGAETSGNGSAEVEPQIEQQADESPKVRKAADAVDRAKAELQKAQACYQKVRRETTDRLKKVREKTLGDLVDDILTLVRKHPGPGVILATLIGFFLGRTFRR